MGFGRWCVGLRLGLSVLESILLVHRSRIVRSPMSRRERSSACLVFSNVKHCLWHQTLKHSS